MTARSDLVGTLLPDAAVVTDAGTPTSLRAVTSGEPAVVYLLRAASCPVCLGHARRILRLACDGALPGRRVLFVVPGDAGDAATALRRTRSIGVATVVASGTAHGAIGLDRTLGLQQSGTLLVDTGGRIEYARLSTMPTGGLDARELTEAGRKRPASR